jgi:hypothetical protein
VKVRLSRSGGFTGVRRAVEVSDEELSPADAARLREAVARARAASLRSTVPAARPRGADQFSYELSVDDGAAPATLRFAEAHGGEELTALAELVEELGRS